MDQNKKLEVRKQKVFEYLVIKHPTIEEAEQGKGSEIVVPLGQLCADDERGAFVRASRGIPDEHMNHESRLEVVIRPF
jgi:hypothetical protein